MVESRWRNNRFQARSMALHKMNWGTEVRKKSPRFDRRFPFRPKFSPRVKPSARLLPWKIWVKRDSSDESRGLLPYLCTPIHLLKGHTFLPPSRPSPHFRPESAGKCCAGCLCIKGNMAFFSQHNQAISPFCLRPTHPPRTSRPKHEHGPGRWSFEGHHRVRPGIEGAWKADLNAAA